MAGIAISIACMIAGYLIDYLVAPIGPMIVEYLLSPIGSVVSYVYYYKRNIWGLKLEIEKLMLARERVQHMVEDARRNGEEVESDVRKWLKCVHEIIEEAERFFGEGANAERSFCCGLLPNVKLRFQASKRAITMVGLIGRLHEEGRFNRVSYSVTRRWKWIAAVEGYKPFESRMPTSKKIMTAFRNEGISIIGVYGMGGVGKTTLLKEVGRQSLVDKLFDDVVMATVTQNPDLKKIQGEIADRLGLRFGEESLAGRAGHLSEMLKKEKHVLVILDDVWAKLDLEAIGIPHGDAHKGCKILLASRSLDVLSTEMDTQINFSVSVLPEDEAWDLFKEMAGDSVEEPDLQPTASEIAKKCAGLPVAIVTVARGLRNKNTYEWKNALRQLQRPNSRNVRGMQAVIYSTLELSYHQLESEEIKSTFLLCGLMNYDASIKDLLRYGMGLDLFHGVYTTEEARDRVDSLVHSLKASCLLVDGSTCDSFSMHDIVRDVALSIASREQHAFVVRDEAKLAEWPDEDLLKECTAISLQNGSSEGLPDQLDCPKLRFFYMGHMDPSFKIPNEFFKGLGALRVLHMTNMHFPALPSSLSFLANVRTLCLNQCMLRDIAIVGELRKLIILSFAGSDIKQLPTDIRNLTRLKVLDLSNCTKLEVIPPNVISSLSQLEELYVANSFHGWEVDPSNTWRRNASITELEHLPHLVYLDIQIPNDVILPKGFPCERLTRFRMLVGNVWDWSGDCEVSRALKLVSSRYSEDGVIRLLRITEDLYLDGLKDLKNILYELDGEGFPRLKHLHIQDSNEIQYLADSVEKNPQHAFPTLETLFLHNLVNLERICHCKLTTESFLKLRVVKVEKCDKLENLFSFSMIGCLLQLQEMKANECKILEEIFTGYGDNTTDNDAETNHSSLRSLELKCLPQLMSFCPKVKRRSLFQLGEKLLTDNEGSKPIVLRDELATATPFFDEKIAFPNLEVLKLASLGIQKLWHDQYLTSSPVPVTSSFQNLTFMSIKGCHNLTYLLSASTSASLVKLKRFEVHKCNFIEDVFSIVREESIDTLLFPELEFLSLKNLPSLKRFCWGKSVEFPSLSKLYIKRCPQLEEFIFTPASKYIRIIKEPGEMKQEGNLNTAMQPLFAKNVVLPSLKVIKITHLHSKEMLWSEQLTDDSLCELKTLKVKRCRKLRSIFPSNTLKLLHNLESMMVIDCDSLEEIFDVQFLSVAATHVAIATRLRSLCLSHLPKLKGVWSKDLEGMFIFGSLETVTVSYCPSLKSLFPAFVARDLVELKQLVIESCSVESIVAVEERLEVKARFVFPQVTNLRLQVLPELRNFYPGLHTSEWPFLKTLEVNGCPNVELLTSDYESFQELQEAGQADILHQPLILVEKDTFRSLEELRLEENGIMKEIWHGEDLAEFFHKIPSHLRELKLSKLSELAYLWKKGLPPGLIFQNLETLNISNCGSLKYLVPSSVSFEHMTTLEISNCDGLISLLMSSTAKSMVQLTSMKVGECQKMREIVVEEEEEEEEKAVKDIVFSKLKYLELHCLPSLACFCSGTQITSFPSLEKVMVRECPELNIFSEGPWSGLKLRVPKKRKRETKKIKNTGKVAYH